VCIYIKCSFLVESMIGDILPELKHQFCNCMIDEKDLQVGASIAEGIQTVLYNLYECIVVQENNTSTMIANFYKSGSGDGGRKYEKLGG